jgi:hypothetical protein
MEITPKWRIVSHIDYWGGENSYDIEHLISAPNSSIIFEMAGEYWQLIAEKGKIQDVINMPTYIIEDWLWANRNTIDIDCAKEHLIRAEAEAKFESMRGPGREESALEKAAEILAVIRDTKIKKIL